MNFESGVLVNLVLVVDFVVVLVDYCFDYG